jgi:hypothetical protein
MSALADWLARQAQGCLDAKRPLTPAQRRALTAIMRCRTPALGGRVYRCASCEETDFAYHSCHHRACPRCGGNRTAAWTAKQEARLLPVPYFLVTFTVPENARVLFIHRPGQMYDLLFESAARALQRVAAQPRLLGAELGFVGVLHTWGRQMQLHPHVHFIVPGGGLRFDHRKWRRTRKPDWLLPVDAVTAAFRREIDEALSAADPAWHAQWPESLWREGWWVNIQPAGSGDQVVRYLARYVHRTAISDERILTATDESVAFRYTDSATQERKTCELTAEEFMRRYLQHVLPPGLHRVRYFGWMHPSAKRRRLIVETLLEVVIVVQAKVDAPPPWHLRCPHCEQFALVCLGSLPRSRAPPSCAT